MTPVTAQRLGASIRDAYYGTLTPLVPGYD
jgi:hypothetical protein